MATKQREPWEDLTWLEEEDDELTVISSEEEEEEEECSDSAKKLSRKTVSPKNKIFSNEDAILLLQRMVDMKVDSPRDAGFYESVKKELSVKTTKIQVVHKIWSMKHAYLAEDPSRSSHGKKLSELCKLIWRPKDARRKTEKKIPSTSHGEESMESKADGSGVKESMKRKTSEKKMTSTSHGGGSVESSKSDLVEKFLVQSAERIGLDEHLVKQRWSQVGINTRKKIEEKLKLVQRKEIECALQRANLLSELTSVISEAV